MEMHLIIQCPGISEGSEGQGARETDHISAPTPCCGKPSSTVTNLLVFLTDALMVALSSGLIVRRLITYLQMSAENKEDQGHVPCREKTYQ
jgi:hypothetical protein